MTISHPQGVRAPLVGNPCSRLSVTATLFVLIQEVVVTIEDGFFNSQSVRHMDDAISCISRSDWLSQTRL